MMYLACYCFLIMIYTLFRSLANDKVKGDVRVWTMLIYFPVALFSDYIFSFKPSLTAGFLFCLFTIS